jgi:hypothetical protein
MSRRRKPRGRDGFAGVAAGEPYFILRAGDFLAPEHVEAWAIEAELNGYPRREVAQARAVAAAMRRWAGRKRRD